MTPENVIKRYPFLVETIRFSRIIRGTSGNFSILYSRDNDYEADIRFYKREGKMNMHWAFDKYSPLDRKVKTLYYIHETPEWFQELVKQADETYKEYEKLRKLI